MLGLSDVKVWVCDFLQPRCLTPTEGIFKPLYKTICFLQTAFCTDSATTAATLHTSTSDFGRPRCKMTHYFGYFFQKISSPWCNITVIPTKPAVIEQSGDNTCQTGDFMDTWSNETSIKEQMSGKSYDVDGAKFCHLNWCCVGDYLDFWLQKLYYNWCRVSGCAGRHTMRLQFESGVAKLESGEPRCAKLIRRWLKEHFGLDPPSNLHILYFIVGSLVIGGYLFIYIFFRRQKKRSQSSSSSASDSESLEQDDLQKIIEKTVRDYCSSLKMTFDKNSQLLEQQRQDIDALQRDNSDKTQIIQVLDQNCKDYQVKVNDLVQHIGNIENKLASAEDDKEQLLAQLEQVQNELYQARTETAEFQTKLERVVSQLREKSMHNLEYQQKIAELQTTLQQIEELYKQQQQQLAESFHETENGEDAITECNQEKTQREELYVVQALKEVDAIRKDTEELEKRIDGFCGGKEDKAYLHLKERLIRNAIKLDNVETEGYFVIRERRKKALDYVNKCIKDLENKVSR